MKLSEAIHRLKYYFQFIPFRISFLIYCGVVYGSYQIIHAVEKNDTNSFIDLTIVMAKVALIFSVIMVSISFLSVVISSIYFYFKERQNNQSALQIAMNTDTQESNVLKINTKIPNALKPVLGFVYVKLFYDKHLSTEKYLLAGRIKNQFIPFKGGLSGENKLALPHIKEYYFSHGLVFFEDMLRFFSFVVPSDVHHTILNTPHSILHNTEESLPKKTEEEQIRIEQLRKVEGELLNYKKFEDSDDVRRIVWKIFAKNKELVVRTPEIMDPFASHIYMYASFYNAFNFELYENYCLTMLNHFKNCVWTIYDTISKKEFEVKYIADQSIAANATQADRIKYTITLSQWHQDMPLADYYKPKNASILCIHSFTSVTDVQNIIANYESGTTIFFMQLSKIFKSYYILNWIMRIFFRTPKDSLTRLKMKWAFHPLKYKLHSNENKIIKILKQHDINFEVL